MLYYAAETSVSSRGLCNRALDRELKSLRTYYRCCLEGAISPRDASQTIKISMCTVPQNESMHDKRLITDSFVKWWYNRIDGIRK